MKTNVADQSTTDKEKQSIAADNDEVNIMSSPMLTIDDNNSSRYGWFNFRPQCLQIFNHPIWLAIVIGLYQLAFMSVNGFKGSIVSTLEKGYNLTATDIAAISVFFNIPNAACGLLFSFLATHGHKGKWIGAGMFITACGLFIYILPHWIIGKYHILDNYVLESFDGTCGKTSLASANVSIATSCRNQVPSSNKFYYFMFSLGQFVTGCGICTLRTIGWSYVDESVSPVVSPLYIGFILLLFAFGPAIGFVIGGLIVDTFVNWPVEPPAGLTPSSPQWLGAWWVGYLIVTIALLCLVMPMLGFPHHLPNYHRYKAEREQLAVGKSRIDNQYGKSLKEFLPALRALLVNVPFMAAVFHIVIQGIVLSGLSAFLPKYVEAQFGLKASESSIYIGIILIVGLLCGTVIGGSIMKRLKMGPVAIAKFTLIASTIGVFLAVSFIFFYCDNSNIPGVFVPYNVNSSLGNKANLSASCNADCKCGINTFDPICDIANNVTYFSPCHAGCHKRMENKQFTEVFFNCSCITGSNRAKSYEAIKSYCPRSCPSFVPFLILLGFLTIASYLDLVPANQLILRCVPESQRGFALAIELFFVQLLGTIPGPLLVGYFIDISCVLWNEDCGERKFCWLYDNLSLTYWIGGLFSTLKAVATATVFIAWYKLNKDAAMDSKAVDESNDYFPKDDIAIIGAEMEKNCTTYKTESTL